MTEAPRIDLSTTHLFAHGSPYEAFHWLRHNDPVYWNPTDSGGFWALTKYDDIAAAYLHPDTYSSSRGTMLGGSFRSSSDTSSGQMLISTDPPRHTQLRQQVHQAGFNPATMARTKECVRACLDAALDRLVEKGGGDIATEVSPAMPTGVLAATMGLPPERAARLQRLTRTMIGFRDDEYRGENSSDVTLVKSQLDIFEFFAELLDERRENPGDDVLTRLLRAEINGRPMHESEILYNCMNLAVGGNETTVHTATFSVLTFIEHPDQYERLLKQPELLGSAMEELFRWTATNTYVQRTLTRPVTIRGRHIEAGDAVTLWNSSANRDEDVFDDPDHFDITRTPNKHLTFGVGRHHCIGATVARFEMEAFLGALLARGLRFELNGPVEKLHSNFAYGIRHLPVALVP